MKAKTEDLKKKKPQLNNVILGELARSSNDLAHTDEMCHCQGVVELDVLDTG